MEYNLSELKKKNVVNVEDGKNLGKITDVVINVPQFDVSAIIVSDKIKIFSRIFMISSFPNRKL